MRYLQLKEKCGLIVNRLSGGVYLDSVRMNLPALCLRTPYSRIDANVAFDFRSFTEGKGGHCQAMIDAILGHQDIATLATGYVAPSYLRLIPATPLCSKER